jgi:hypothetical protein
MLRLPEPRLRMMRVWIGERRTVEGGGGGASLVQRAGPSLPALGESLSPLRRQIGTARGCWDWSEQPRGAVIAGGGGGLAEKLP